MFSNIFAAQPLGIVDVLVASKVAEDGSEYQRSREPAQE
jgi:hypothetical protein